MTTMQESVLDFITENFRLVPTKDQTLVMAVQSCDSAKHGHTHDAEPHSSVDEGHASGKCGIAKTMATASRLNKAFGAGSARVEREGDNDNGLLFVTGEVAVRAVLGAIEAV